MKDPKRRVFHDFLKLFADEKSEPSPTNIVNSGQSLVATTPTPVAVAEDSSLLGSKSIEGIRMQFDEKSVEWVSDNDGYKTVFINILSYLDEYDLALSIQPTCKLFQNFSRIDELWKNLLESKYREWYDGQEELWEARKLYEKLLPPKELLVRLVRDYYISSFSRSRKQYFLNTPSTFRNGGMERMCATCQDNIEEEDVCITRYSGLCRGAYEYHFDCVDKEQFRENYPHVLCFVKEDSIYKEELINTFYKTKLFNESCSASELDEEDKLPEFSCDICEELIYGIRYNCLDCGEYDLCGYCCEKVIMKQRGSSLGMCQLANHPLDHTFQSVGEDEFDTYSCNNCKEKIRGYRFHNTNTDDYDLCTLCFYEVESKELYEKIDLYGISVIEELYTTFCQKLLLKELKAVFQSIDEDCSGRTKKELSSLLTEILNERKESGNRSNLCHLVANVDRFCCKGEDGNILPSSACNALVASLDLAHNTLKPTKKKTKVE